MLGFVNSTDLLACKHAIETVGKYDREGEASPASAALGQTHPYIPGDDKTMAQCLDEMEAGHLEPRSLEPLSEFPSFPNHYLRVAGGVSMFCDFFESTTTDLEANVASMRDTSECWQMLRAVMEQMHRQPDDRRLILCVDACPGIVPEPAGAALNLDLIRVRSGDEAITVPDPLWWCREALNLPHAFCLEVHLETSDGEYRLEVSADARVHATVREALGLNDGFEAGSLEPQPEPGNLNANRQPNPTWAVGPGPARGNPDPSLHPHPNSTGRRSWSSSGRGKFRWMKVSGRPWSTCRSPSCVRSNLLYTGRLVWRTEVGSGCTW